MISSLYNLNKSQTIICQIDDASIDLYINVPKNDVCKKSRDRLWIFAMFNIYKSCKSTTSKPFSVKR